MTQPQQTNSHSAKNPLSILVMAQILDIRKQEAALQNRFRAVSDPFEIESFHLELAKLSDRAERANRMLDAIGPLFPWRRPSIS